MRDSLDRWQSFWLSKAPKDELTFLFRNIVNDRIPPDSNIVMSWQHKMEHYLNDPTNGVPANGKDRSSARGNMNKALRSGTMSWKIFKIGLKFLQARAVRFQVIIDWGPGTDATVHQISRTVFNDPSPQISVTKLTIPTIDAELGEIPILKDIVDE